MTSSALGERTSRRVASGGRRDRGMAASNPAAVSSSTSRASSSVSSISGPSELPVSTGAGEFSSCSHAMAASASSSSVADAEDSRKASSATTGTRLMSEVSRGVVLSMPPEVVMLNSRLRGSASVDRLVVPVARLLLVAAQPLTVVHDCEELRPTSAS